MDTNRKGAEEYLLTWLDKIDPSKLNGDRYRALFKSFSDKQFDAYITALETDVEKIYIYVPNMKLGLDLANLRQIAIDLEIKLFERIRLYDAATQTYYLTPHEYLVLELPVRKMSQYLDHKLQVPQGDSKIDILTGQVVKPDKAASLSQVEVQALKARGLDYCSLELVKFRGGDVAAWAQMRRELEEQGEASLPEDTGSVARSGVLLDVLFSGMHLETNATGM